jgi:hypothetical protein
MDYKWKNNNANIYMNKAEVEKYMVAVAAGLSIFINYYTGFDNTFFFIMISIFTFSLTRNLMIGAPFVLVATYVYITYFGYYIEGAKGGSNTPAAEKQSSSGGN